MKYIIKKHISHEGKVIIAMCDIDIIGKKYEEEGLQLDLTSIFYKGDELDGPEVEAVVKQANTINIVGKNSISFCLEKGFINKNNILKINGIPYAQALILKEE